MAARSATIVLRVRQRLRKRMFEAFTFLVATSWAALFNDIFSLIAGEDASLLMRAVHAVMFTVFAVLITMLLDVDDVKNLD
jgi:uncharacterized membrane protein